jgi:hypothetical protein
MPGITCVTSIVFLVSRAKISGLHKDPAFASLNSSEAIFYSLPSNLNFSYDSVVHIISRYINIIFSFYLENINYDLNYKWFYCTFFVVLLIYIIRIDLKINRKLTCALLVIAGGTLLLQFFGLMHIAPKRHQLVLFLPVALLSSIWVGEVFLKKIRIAFLILITIIVIIFKVYFFNYIDNGFPHNYAITYFKSVGVERLVLNKCDYEPILSADIRTSYSPIYSCGPKVIQKLPLDVKKIAIWSSLPIEKIAVEEIISNYSSYSWSISSPSDLESNDGCIDCSKLWIAEFISEKR